MSEFDHEEKIMEQIKESLDHLNESLHVETPDLNYFRKMVATVEKKKSERAKKELLLFIFFAAVVLTVETIAFHLSFMFFAVIQSGALVAAITGMLHWFRLERRKVKSV